MSHAEPIPAYSAPPPNVPPDLVIDFDTYAVPGAEDDVQLAWHCIQQTLPEIFWTPRNGGHWVATRAKDIETIQIDHTRFSMVNTLIPSRPRPFPVPPIDLDPPRHHAYRLVIAPAFSPKMVAELRETVRGLMMGLVDDIAPRGECEFISEVAKVLPIVVFLKMMGLPAEDRERLLPFAEMITRSPSPEDATAARLAMADYLKDWIDLRRRQPSNDLISRVAHAKVNGERMRPEEVLGMCVLLLSGGLDTVASMLGFVARFLAASPLHRRQIIDDPGNMPNAIEELFRRHGLSNTARVITHDFVYNGLQFRKGEVIQIPNCLYGLDERRVDNPLEVDFHRPAPIPHATFGNGPHKCPGAILARGEVQIFLEEWLRRIPDFQVKRGTKPQMRAGSVNGIQELHLSWKVS